MGVIFVSGDFILLYLIIFTIFYFISLPVTNRKFITYTYYKPKVEKILFFF